MMKRNKRNVFRILCGVLSVSIMMFCALTLVGCGTETGSSEQTSQSQTEPNSESAEEITVSLNKKTLNLVEWESVTLVAEKTGTDEAIVWKSTNETVATVDGNGKVTALAVGETTITAQVGDVSDSCRVVVEKSSAEPVLAIEELDEEKQLILRDSGSFVLHASVLWNGEAIDGATISWTSDNEEIAIVTGNGYEVSVSGLKEGETTIRVVATVRGKTAVYEFNVKVNPESALLKTDDEAFAPISGGYKVTINAVEETVGDKTNVTALDFYASYKNEKIENPSIVWTTENDDIIEMDAATGKITAKQSGIALISGVWHYDVTDKDYSIKVNVEVVRVNVAIDNVADVVVNRAEAFELTLADETIQSYDVDGKSFTDGFAADGNVVKFDGENFDVNDQTKVVGVKIVTNKRVYSMNVNSYYAIADLNEWKSVWNATASAKIFTKASVIKIEKDLNVSSYAPSPNISYANKTSFSGIFDGQGHTIVGATAGWESLFNSVSESGVIKNVAFIGITLKQETTMFYNKFDGTIENCYFEAGIDRKSINATPAFTCTLGRTAVIRNVVMNIRGRGNNEKNAEQKAIFRYFGTGEGSPIISGLYASVDVSDGVASYETTINDSMNVYSSMTEMRTALTSLPEKFSSDIWEVYDGMLVFKSSENVIADYIEQNKLTVTEIASVNKEVETPVSADKACEWIIEGLDSSMYTFENGVLTLSSAAPVGGTFTIVATYTETRFGHTYTEKIENIVIKNKPAEVKNLDVKPIVGLNRTTETYSFALDEAAEILGVTIGGAATDKYTVNGNVVTINAAAFETLGDVEIVIETDEVLYKAAAEVFDYALGSLDEFKTYWNTTVMAGTVTATAVLTADIDAATWNNNGNMTTPIFAGLLDGRGYTISNAMAGYNGFFYNLASTGVIKNVAFVGMRLLVKPLIFGYKLEGTIENCYFEGATTRTNAATSPALCMSLGRTAVIRNVVVNIHDSLSNQAGQNALFNYYIEGNGLPTIEGLYAIVDYSNGTASKEATANEKIRLYATAAEMRADVTELPEGFSSDIWQMYDGILSFKSSEDVIKTYINGITFELNAIDSVNKETETTLSANKTCAWSIEGLDSSMYTFENGVLTLSSAAPVGGTFTIVATYTEMRFGHTYTEKIENIVIKNKPAEVKNLDVKPIVGLNRTTETYSFALDEAAEVLGVTIGGAATDKYTVNGNVVTINADAFAALGEVEIVIETENIVYKASAEVFDMAIGTLAEFKTFWSKTTFPSGGTVTLNVVFTEDIDASSYSFNGGTVIANVTFNGLIDGKGHTVKGAQSTYYGMFYCLGANAVIKDVAFTGIRFYRDSAIVSDKLEGRIENCYFEGSGGSAASKNALAMRLGNTAVIKDVVVYLHDRPSGTEEQAGVFNGLTNGTTGVTIAPSGVYVINTSSNGSICGSSGTTDLSGINLYASLEEFKTANETKPNDISEKYWNYLAEL